MLDWAENKPERSWCQARESAITKARAEEQQGQARNPAIPHDKRRWDPSFF
jgi:hypothetical protein